MLKCEEKKVQYWVFRADSKQQNIPKRTPWNPSWVVKLFEKRCVYMVELLWEPRTSENIVYLQNIPQNIMGHFHSLKHNLLLVQDEARPAWNQKNWKTKQNEKQDKYYIN